MERGGPEIVNDLGCADRHNNRVGRFRPGEASINVKMRPMPNGRWRLSAKPFEKAGRFDQQSMVCGQCHVSTTLDGKNKAVKFPCGMRGMKVEKYV